MSPSLLILGMCSVSSEYFVEIIQILKFCPNLTRKILFAVYP